MLTVIDKKFPSFPRTLATIQATRCHGLQVENYVHNIKQSIQCINKSPPGGGGGGEGFSLVFLMKAFKDFNRNKCFGTT